MADKIDAAARSRNMARIRSANTKPEMTVRRAVHAAGFRYRLHAKELPGKPDLVFPRHRLAVFVHGCFWHLHTCREGRIPSSNSDYWKPKLKRNVARHKEAEAALQTLGWRTFVLWECSIAADIDTLLNILAAPR